MTTLRLPLILFVLFIALAVSILALGPLPAHSAGAEAAAPAEFEIVATGLNNPRGMAFAQDGSLYIAESGSGGPGPCIPGAGGAEFCLGETGGVTLVEFSSDGTPADQTRVIEGLSSLAIKDTGGDATGPNDVAFTESGQLLILMGLGNDPAVRDPMGSLGAKGMDFGQLVYVDEEMMRGNVADVAGYEGANNPDGAQVDSNPFGMLVVEDEVKVADAGANALLNVANFQDTRRNAPTADISTLAVFPAQMVEFPPGSGMMIPMDAVPTAVEIGPDGAFYVSGLTGFPFPVGGANIYRVEPGSDPQVYASGFTNVLDLAFGPDGALYVLEMAKDSLLGPPPPLGRIVQVAPYGAQTTIVSEGLNAPLDLEIGPDHALYVINNGPTEMGTVVRMPLPSTTVAIPAAKDNTLYESETGEVSNGMGQYFFSGLTGVRTGNLALRGLVAFDVESAIPEGSMVISATLDLHMSRTNVGDKTVTLHTVQKNWGEGDSDAEAEEGGGAKAAAGDATWLHSQYDNAFWDAPGGDFSPSASAGTLVGGAGEYSWSSDQVRDEVQAWVDGSADNHGWLLMGDESGGASAKRFDTRENPNEENRPKLHVRYITPLPDYAIFMPVVLRP